ncbi:MAG: hypothetical protein PUA94_00745 [Bacteroidales bacterium]|nr:hypothetical protein [Bacteroidales bacterium]
MRKIKTLAIALAAVVVCTAPADAQFLKKLGNALNKGKNALEKVANSTSSTQSSYGKQLGKSIKLGDMTMTAYGDNPGVGFNFDTCLRDGNNVILYFQLPNQCGRDIENVWIRNYEPNETEAFNANGSKYTVARIAFGDRGSNEGLTVNIPANGYVNGAIVITGVPADVKELHKVVFRLSGQYVMDAVTHSYTFVLDNVAIKDKEADSTQSVSYTKPAEGWMMTSEGVGPVKLGASVKSLPAKVDGLYTKMEDGCYFYNGDEQVMYVELNGDKIRGISVCGKNVGIKIGGKIFRVGGDSDVLKTQPGVKGVSYNDDADYNGIHFIGHDSEIQSFSVGEM